MLLSRLGGENEKNRSDFYSSFLPQVEFRWKSIFLSFPNRGNMKNQDQRFQIQLMEFKGSLLRKENLLKGGEGKIFEPLFT